jgi:hypothetical protein
VWIELQRVIFDFVRKKAPALTGAFFVLFGAFLRVVLENVCFLCGGIVVNCGRLITVLWRVKICQGFEIFFQVWGGGRHWQGGSVALGGIRGYPSVVADEPAQGNV